MALSATQEGEDVMAQQDTRTRADTGTAGAASPAPGHQAARKIERATPAAIVELIRRSCGDADDAVQAAAFDAVRERYKEIEHSELSVAGRSRRRPGTWRVVSGRDGHSYTVLINSVDPVSLSCSCADFVRNSLGVCAHGLLVLRQASTSDVSSSTLDGRRLRLVWDPAHPVRGASDRLLRLRLEGSGSLVIPGFEQGRLRPDAISRLGQRQDVLRALLVEVEDGRLDAEPGAKKVVEDELVRANEARAAIPVFLRSQGALRSLKRQLFPHQRKAVRAFLRKGRQLFADNMGDGKTTQAVAGCHGLLRSRSVRRVLLVVPHALKSQWEREWRAITDEPLTTVSGSPRQRAEIYGGTSRGALLISTNQLRNDLASIREWDPEVVVIDEAQRIKNVETKSAAAAKSLSPRYRLALTGTPMENKLDDLGSVMEFVDDSVLAPLWRLAPFHTFIDEEDGSSGARHLDILRDRLTGVVTRRPKSEGLKELPTRVDERVLVPMTPEQTAEHDELKPPIAALMSMSGRRPLLPAEVQKLLRLLTRQRMIANGLAQVRFDDIWDGIRDKAPTPGLLQSLFTPKLGILRTLVSDIVVTQQRKMVVFSQWLDMVDLGEWAIRDLLAEAGLRSVLFTGRQTKKGERDRALVAFAEDPTAAVLFLTDAGGTGLNLQTGTACVQLELPWNPAVMEQRIARIHRHGQTQPVEVFHLVSENSIEAHIAGLLGRKRALFNTLFDTDEDEIEFSESSAFLSTVREICEADARAAAAPEQSAAEASTEPCELGVVTEDVLEEAEGSQRSSPVKTPLYQVTQKADGGLTIDVPVEMAAPLAELLASLAQTLRGPARAA